MPGQRQCKGRGLAGWLAGRLAGWREWTDLSSAWKGMIVHRVSEEQWRATTTTAAIAPPPRSCVEEPAPAPSEPRSTSKLPDRVLTATLKKPEINRDTTRQSAQKCPSGPRAPPLLTLSLPWSYHIISWLCAETNCQKSFLRAGAQRQGHARAFLTKYLL